MLFKQSLNVCFFCLFLFCNNNLFAIYSVTIFYFVGITLLNKMENDLHAVRRLKKKKDWFLLLL